MQVQGLSAQFPVMVSVGPWIMLSFPYVEILELEGLLGDGCAKHCPSRPLENPDSSEDRRSDPVVDFHLGRGFLRRCDLSPAAWRGDRNTKLWIVSKQEMGFAPGRRRGDFLTFFSTLMPTVFLRALVTEPLKAEGPRL